MHFRGRGVEILGTLFTCFIVAAGGTPCNALYISSQRRGAKLIDGIDARQMLHYHDPNTPSFRSDFALPQRSRHRG